MNFKDKSKEQIETTLLKKHPELPYVFDLVRERVPFIKREIRDYEAYYLYHVAKMFDKPNVSILEIGTAWGFSCAWIASAAKQANITTLNPKVTEFLYAQKYLERYTNVQALNTASEVYLKQNPNRKFDFVFVDGGHDAIHLDNDTKFWDNLNPNGIILYHDYSPVGSGRPCPTVYNYLNDYRDNVIKRDFDFYCISDDNVGVVGWQKT